MHCDTMVTLHTYNSHVFLIPKTSSFTCLYLIIFRPGLGLGASALMYMILLAHFEDVCYLFAWVRCMYSMHDYSGISVFFPGPVRIIRVHST